MISDDVKSRKFRCIIAQWDALAPSRRAQIETGKDITYRYFLMPQIEKLLGNIEGFSILDAGCGVGFFSQRLIQKGAVVTGIDPSPVSIALAKEGGMDLVFRNLSLEAYSYSFSSVHNIVLANMVMMDVLDLNEFLKAASCVLTPGGRLVFSMTHPWFWPQYMGYSTAEWFNYNKTTIIEAPFTITNDQNSILMSTHVHRPLETYLEAFEKSGFRLLKLREPMPDHSVSALYPQNWEFPRYLFGVLER